MIQDFAMQSAQSRVEYVIIYLFTGYWVSMEQSKVIVGTLQVETIDDNMSTYVLLILVININQAKWLILCSTFHIINVVP